MANIKRVRVTESGASEDTGYGMSVSRRADELVGTISLSDSSVSLNRCAGSLDSFIDARLAELRAELISRIRR